MEVYKSGYLAIYQNEIKIKLGTRDTAQPLKCRTPRSRDL